MRWNDNGTTSTTTRPTRLVAFLGRTSPTGGPFHSTLSHNGSHNNYMACEREAHHDTSSLLLLLATLKIPMISIPFFESQFLGSYMIMRCVLCSFNFYNSTNFYTLFKNNKCPISFRGMGDLQGTLVCITITLRSVSSLNNPQNKN